MKNAYRACAEIDLDALEYNITKIREKIGADTKLMCVIKANAYGHGAVVFARELAAMGADSFAVATLEEGIELRRSGITQPILILGFVCREQYPDMIRYKITPTVFTYNMAKDIDTAAHAMGETCCIHIKIDTGMSRIGFPVSEDSVKSIVMISHLLSNVRIDGIFTHFACADCMEDEMTKEQAAGFVWMADSLERAGVSIPCRHCSNSASIMRYPELKMNMVRAGIIIYGLYPSDEVDPALLPLKPVMSLKSHVAHIKTVPAGTKVGYGATFVCNRPTTIATVSIGYADGYPRALSNKGRVLIGSASYPVIGRVCMDQIMVDITDSTGRIKCGDLVTLIGGKGKERISVEEAAGFGDSFNYEFVCNINRRVPRVYLRGGKVQEVVNFIWTDDAAPASL